MNFQELTDLEAIFHAGLRRADPYRMIVEHVAVEGDTLSIRFENHAETLDLRQFEKIFVLGAGKAAPAMARAVEDRLGQRLTGGLISTKYGYGGKLRLVEQIEAGHPVPDENSLLAARCMGELAQGFDAKTLVITVISGGGSALLDGLVAFEDGSETVQLSLDDLRATTAALLASGATINEINTIRKHLSTVKGGRFLQMLAPATSVNLILSDVVGDRLDAIASGLTAPDPTTFADALAVVEKYALAGKIPARVLRALQVGAAGRLPETLKPGDALLAKTRNILIGTLRNSLLAAAEEARRRGYHPLVLTAQLTGEAREAAKFLLACARETAQFGGLAPKPACLIAGGETTVTLRGGGKGGRNQEMALAFLCELAANPAGAERIAFLSAATDGTDGPTDAAGAFASLDLAQRAAQMGLDAAASLRENDSYHFYEKLGALFKTGATGTNVCDIQIVLVEK